MIRRETEQRNIVYKAACSLYHPTAEEVYALLASKNSGVGRTTVFRNLAVLTEEGKFVKLCFADQPARYDTNPLPHDHFVCKYCGRIIDIESCCKVTPPSGLNVTNASVTFYGACPECLKLFGGDLPGEHKTIVIDNENNETDNEENEDK